MPLDPQVRELLERKAAQPGPPLEEQSPEEARESMSQDSKAFERPGGLASIRNSSVPGPAGSIPVRVYTPKGESPHPALVWFHGGGWVLGDLETHDAVCRYLALACGTVVVAVDYRLAPEHPFPAAVDDAEAATGWVWKNAASMGVDPDRLAVGGDSAGGNLAAVVCLRARDGGEPPLRWQLLVYPITDCDLDTVSYRDNGVGYSLTRAGMEWFWTHYVPEPSARTHSHASPLRAPDLSRLPPAYVITAEYDPLRDEGEAYARRLADSGVKTRLDRFPGMIHGFVRRSDELTAAQVAFGRIASEMSAALAPRG